MFDSGFHFELVYPTYMSEPEPDPEPEEKKDDRIVFVKSRPYLTVWSQILKCNSWGKYHIVEDGVLI